MKLIDKSALVAEIEKIKTDALQKKSQCKRRGLEKIMHQIGAYNKVLSFLDTLEAYCKEAVTSASKNLIPSGVRVCQCHHKGWQAHYGSIGRKAFDLAYRFLLQVRKTQRRIV